MSSIVLGLGFGDEGKGLTTSFLCSQTNNPMVVRFNGGHQAGHTVNYKGKRHVFSHFGAGTLQGVPTYWSEYCTFEPSGFLQEYKKLGIPVDIYINPLCPVTTPWDIIHNREREQTQQHGSVGLGFGATIQRQEDHYKLFVQDLFHKSVMIAKWNNIARYYKQPNDYDLLDQFIEDVREVIKIIMPEDNRIMNGYNCIFEGAQGILLDMDFGFFPNVTRSNTTSKNAIELIEWRNRSKKERSFFHNHIYYVTRSYLTRHGNGYFPSGNGLTLKNNELETNKQHEFQGRFKTGELDIELMKYALKCDNHYSKGLHKNLVITCLDQYPIDVDALVRQLPDFLRVYTSHGDSLEDMKLFKRDATNIHAYR